MYWTEYGLMEFLILDFEGHSITKRDTKQNSLILKAYYFMKVGLVDLGTLGGKIKFEFCRPALRCLDSQNSNLIFPP